MNIDETSGQNLDSDPDSYAVQRCEQGCLTSFEQCEEDSNKGGDACTSEFQACADSCRKLLAYPSS